jgi:hypothetical protein
MPQLRIETGKWKTKRLGTCPPDKHRFHISGVKKEMVLAWLVDVEGIEVWAPKSVCDIGISPDGKFYCFDCPKWFAIKNKLI